MRRAVVGQLRRADPWTVLRASSVARHEFPKRGVPLSKAAELAQLALAAHNAEETPLSAKDIERNALGIGHRLALI